VAAEDLATRLGLHRRRVAHEGKGAPLPEHRLDLREIVAEMATDPRSGDHHGPAGIAHRHRLAHGGPFHMPLGRLRAPAPVPGAVGAVTDAVETLSVAALPRDRAAPRAARPAQSP